MNSTIVSYDLQYLGLQGITRPAVSAIVSLLTSSERIREALLLTNKQDHCWLAWSDRGDCTAIKSGLTSGYSGEGPQGLSDTILLLDTYGVEIDEVYVPSDILDRIGECRLTTNDLQVIAATKRVRPIRLFDYVLDPPDTNRNEAWESLLAGRRRSIQEDRWTANLASRFPPIPPMAIVHRRILDLSLEFPDGDDIAFRAFRRLEDDVRYKSGLRDLSGTKLFRSAFLGKEPQLGWAEIDASEVAGRVELFTGSYQSARNPRAHTESDNYAEHELRAFLLANELFHLLEDAAPRRDQDLS